MKKTPLARFETFTVVAEKQSFTNAAKALGITKSAVSLAVKQLENELGMPLFTRSTRRIELTEEGELLYEQCNRIQYELNSARELVSRMQNEPSGHLKISCNYIISESYLMPHLHTYMKKFPKVSVEVVIEQRVPDFKKEQVDIAFGMNWYKAPDDLIAKKIHSSRYVLCASPDYLKKHGTPKTLAELNKHCYIHHTGRDIKNPIVSTKKAPPKLKPHMPFMSNFSEVIKHCVLDGVGIGEFHEYVIQKELESGELVEILSEYLNKSEPIFAYYNKYRFVQPKIRELIKIFDQASELSVNYKPFFSTTGNKKEEQ